MGKPNIILESDTPKDLEDVTLTKAVVMEDDTQVKRKAHLKALSNIELMIQPFIELEDAAKSACLNLDTDEEKATVIRECLRDPIGEAYDMSIATIKVEEDNEIEVLTWFNGVFKHQTCRATIMDTF
jgi:hypothetical protein